MSKIKKMIKLATIPEMSILPGHLAFFVILAIFPITSLLGVLSSLFASADYMSQVFSYLPDYLEDILLPFFNESLNTFNITFIAIGLYVSSNAAYAIITASNTVYKFPKKDYIHQKIKAIFMTFWIIILFIISLIVLAFGSSILDFLIGFSSIGSYIAQNIVVITIMQFVLSSFVIFITIKVLYTMAPDGKIFSKNVNIGALFTTLGILLVTTGFSFYFNNLANYEVFYGYLANIAAMMLIIYFISYIFILGIIINNYYYSE